MQPPWCQHQAPRRSWQPSGHSWFIPLLGHQDSQFVHSDLLCKSLCRGPFHSIFTPTSLVSPQDSVPQPESFCLPLLTAAPITFHPPDQPHSQVIPSPQRYFYHAASLLNTLPGDRSLYSIKLNLTLFVISLRTEGRKNPLYMMYLHYAMDAPSSLQKLLLFLTTRTFYQVLC